MEVEQVCSVIDSGSENLCERALHQTTYITELPIYHSMDLHKNDDSSKLVSQEIIIRNNIITIMIITI